MRSTAWLERVGNGVCWVWSCILPTCWSLSPPSCRLVLVGIEIDPSPQRTVWTPHKAWTSSVPFRALRWKGSSGYSRWAMSRSFFLWLRLFWYSYDCPRMFGTDEIGLILEDKMIRVVWCGHPRWRCALCRHGILSFLFPGIMACRSVGTRWSSQGLFRRRYESSDPSIPMQGSLRFDRVEYYPKRYFRSCQLEWDASMFTNYSPSHVSKDATVDIHLVVPAHQMALVMWTIVSMIFAVYTGLGAQTAFHLTLGNSYIRIWQLQLHCQHPIAQSLWGRDGDRCF